MKLSTNISFEDETRSVKINDPTIINKLHSDFNKYYKLNTYYPIYSLKHFWTMIEPTNIYIETKGSYVRFKYKYLGSYFVSKLNFLKRMSIKAKIIYRDFNKLLPYEIIRTFILPYLGYNNVYFTSDKELNHIIHRNSHTCIYIDKNYIAKEKEEES